MRIDFEEATEFERIKFGQFGQLAHAAPSLPKGRLLERRLTMIAAAALANKREWSGP